MATCAVRHSAPALLCLVIPARTPRDLAIGWSAFHRGGIKIDSRFNLGRRMLRIRIAANKRIRIGVRIPLRVMMNGLS